MFLTLVALFLKDARPDAQAIDSPASQEIVQDLPEPIARPAKRAETFLLPGTQEPAVSAMHPCLSQTLRAKKGYRLVVLITGAEIHITFWSGRPNC